MGKASRSASSKYVSASFNLNGSERQSARAKSMKRPIDHPGVAQIAWMSMNRAACPDHGRRLPSSMRAFEVGHWNFQVSDSHDLRLCHHLRVAKEARLEVAVIRSQRGARPRP